MPVSMIVENAVDPHGDVSGVSREPRFAQEPLAGLRIKQVPQRRSLLLRDGARPRLDPRHARILR